jgi:3D (Asp-Asp-Asp) domain-containing protein
VRNTIYHKGYRVIASDNSVIPLYSIVQVDTKNESFKAIVLDRGGGINNYEIDLLVRNETDATNFGRQRALITVLKEGNS